MPRFGHSLPKEKLGGLGVPSWLPDWLTGKDVRPIQGPVYIPPRGKAGGYRKELAADIARKAKDPFTQRDIYSAVQAGADFIPLVGEDVGVRETAEDIEAGNYGAAALGGLGTVLGTVPVVGDMAATGLKGLAKGLREAAEHLPNVEKTASAVVDPIRAYHGSPYHFETFDPARLGTGEGGANAGRGINLTEDVGEAHTYINPSTRFGIGGETVKAKGPGHVYEVDIGAGREQFVDLDAPLNQQPQDVQDAVREWSDKAERGSERRLSFYLREGRDVEDRLSGLGYKGLTTDRVSGNRQYTVFDPGILSIRNPPQGLGTSAVVDPVAPQGLGVTNLGAVRQERKVAKDVAQIKDVVANFEGDALKRGAEYHKTGKLPVAVGTRMVPPRGSGDTAPWEVTGHYVDPNNPERYGYHLKDPVTGDTRIEIANDPRLGVKDKLIGWKPMGVGGVVDPVAPQGLGGKRKSRKP